MNPTINTIVTGVTPKAVSSNGRAFTIYEVASANNITFSTTKKELADSAISLLNQQVMIEYTVKQKGEYTNYYLEQVLPAGNVAAQAWATQQATNPDFLNGVAGTAPLPEPKIDKDVSIHRQVATKVAAALAPQSPQEFWANVTALFHYYQTGDTPALAEALAGVGATDTDIPF